MAMAEPPPRDEEVLAGLEFDVDDVEIVDVTGFDHKAMIKVILDGSIVDVSKLNDVDLSTLRGFLRQELLERGEIDYIPERHSPEGEKLHSAFIATHVEYFKRREERKG